MHGGDGADDVRADGAAIDAVNAGSGEDVAEAHDDADTDPITYGEGTDTAAFAARVEVVANERENTDPHQ